MIIDVYVIIRLVLLLIENKNFNFFEIKMKFKIFFLVLFLLPFTALAEGRMYSGTAEGHCTESVSYTHLKLPTKRIV